MPCLCYEDLKHLPKFERERYELDYSSPSSGWVGPALVLKKEGSRYISSVHPPCG